MYSIELKDLTLSDAQNRVLQAVENICDTYHLEEQFGIISYGMYELVTMVEHCAGRDDATFTVNFYIHNDRISVQLSGAEGLSEINRLMTEATFEDAKTEAFTVACLTDSHEGRADGKELWLDILASPTFDTPSRAEVSQQESVRTLQA